MADPERLDAALAALTLPAEPSPDDFQARWTAWTYDGRTLGLPPGWRTPLVEYISYGLTRDDLEECVDVAMSNGSVPGSRKFVYALGAAKRRARMRRQEQLGLLVVEPKPNLATMGPYIRTPSGHVHLPGCRTLERANPWNARAVASLVPFRPCSVCL